MVSVLADVGTCGAVVVVSVKVVLLKVAEVILVGTCVVFIDIEVNVVDSTVVVLE